MKFERGDTVRVMGNQADPTATSEYEIVASYQGKVGTVVEGGIQTATGRCIYVVEFTDHKQFPFAEEEIEASPPG
ncbi:MAG: hypothetical protein HYV08_08435 [Deltaproteobacteria bacterium]|nr:hypothetical protein [Deltaproteobacteria bacterium]MBI3078922.1 hypothetical protein [Deltaproteobacteria bacterium]